VAVTGHLGKQMQLAGDSVETASDCVSVLPRHHQDQVGIVNDCLGDVSGAVSADVHVAFAHHLLGVGGGRATFKGPDARRAYVYLSVCLLAD